jgi:hypothetical protein
VNWLETQRSMCKEDQNLDDHPLASLIPRSVLDLLTRADLGC